MDADSCPDLRQNPDLRQITERIAALDRLTDAKFVTQQVLMESQARQVALALEASEKAITKAEAAMEKRFDGVNEFRQTLSDQAANFVSRDQMAGLEKQLVTLEKAQSRTVGIAVGISSTITVMGVVVAALFRVSGH